MGWTVEQNTGVNGHVVRCVWFKGYIYAFTQDDGVWRRDGVGPWTQVFNGTGLGWYWADDDALYCPGPAGGEHIHRSEDGLAWPEDIDLLATFGAHAGGWWHTWGAMGGYGDYFYYENHDVGGAGTTYFYRRDLDGNWDMPFATHVGAEGANGRGIIGFGGKVYWTNMLYARYWDGAAWSIETTLNGQGSTYMSAIDNKLYVCTDPSHSLVGGYYWKTTAATTWAFMNLPIPDNTWWVWTLCEGADGETYTLTSSGLNMRIYQKVGSILKLIAGQASIAAGVGTCGGICVDAAGAMYWGTRALGTIRFFYYDPDYDVTPEGGGLYPQAMDCDADGDALYIAVYDAAGQPALIKVMLPLATGSMGSTMFGPAAGGSAINVQCTGVGQRLAISGRLSAGGNDSVQVSTDAALSWTDVAPAWGDTAQPIEVSPDTLDKIMACLDANQDIVETLDQGTLWLTRNAAVGYSPGAMARLPQGDELLVGDDAANRIDYSPNQGATLHNITGAFQGNVAALEVV